MRSEKEEPEKEEREEEEPEKEEPEKDDDKEADKPDSDDDDLRSRVEKLVSEALGKLGGPRPLGSTTEEIARRVREAQDDLAKKEKDTRTIADLKTQVRKLTERPPGREGIGGKVQRFLWGEE